jgi:Asp-tRNA(Asn)/Glu-tRNA(Gln) amidotransferase A subunit family amidase
MQAPSNYTARTNGATQLLLAACVLAVTSAPALAQPALDLERLDGPTLAQMLDEGKLTSVKLVKAYIARIEALNKRGPGLNAVTQLNPLALEEAAQMDAERKAGQKRSIAHGLPVLLKDLIDVKGMYTSNGNYSLRESFPEDDSGVVKKLKENGVIILGKLGLSEYANSFGNQPSGFANLTGQVVHGLDADQNPSGSSSGSGTAGTAALAALIVGTETSGSIISPSRAQSLVGIRPTVGLVPAYGIGPISSSQDTAGPMDRTVATAAMHLQVMSGRDSKNEAGYEEVFGANWEESITRAPEVLPDYMSALDHGFVNGKRIGYAGGFDEGTPQKIAFDALVAAGAIMVERIPIPVGDVPGLPTGYQQHNAINLYYRNLGPLAPIKSLAEEVADNIANAHEALKFGHNAHLNASMSDVTVGGANQLAYQAAMPVRRAAQWLAINRTMANDTLDDPSDDFIAILTGSNSGLPNGATAGTPQITIPVGYTTTHRRAMGADIHGAALSEFDLIGVAFVIEQGTLLRQPVSELNPSMYRCAKTKPKPPYVERGDCNPTFEDLARPWKNAPELDFALEMASIADLGGWMEAGTLTAHDLTQAYLARIAMTNAEGPAIQSVRMVKPSAALSDANKLDNQRKRGLVYGPLHGMPALVSDVVDVESWPTTGGSIALQNALARKDATLVSKLEAAGAVIMGKTNVTELNGLFDANLPEGYSSLGGQVMLPSDTDKTTAGSSAGSAAAVASGQAAFAIGLETSTDSAQLIAPAGVAGVVGLKPTVGLVSRAGILPAAKTQDSPGPITRTVWDAAAVLEVIAGPDPLDEATAGAPEDPDYLSGLVAGALAGARVAVIDSTTAPYPTVVTTLQNLGATTVVTTIGTPDPNPASIVMTEFERDLDAYLAGLRYPKGGAKTLAGIVAYNDANPVEGLKYQQGELLAAAAVDLTVPETAAAYEADKAAGLASNQAIIDGILANGTPEPEDDLDFIVVPNNSPLIGIADRAGYPILTVPAGYGTGNQGRNPIGVAFVGPALSEATLLAAGFDFEQATLIRQAPSFTNPSMWRCVPGSFFFSPHHCHPGDLLASS